MLAQARQTMQGQAETLMLQQTQIRVWRNAWVSTTLIHGRKTRTATTMHMTRMRGITGTPRELTTRANLAPTLETPPHCTDRQQMHLRVGEELPGYTARPTIAAWTEVMRLMGPTLVVPPLAVRRVWAEISPSLATPLLQEFLHSQDNL